MDGASRQTGAGLGMQLKVPTGEVIEHAIHLNFFAFNNKVEYEAIIAELDLAFSVSSEKNHHKKPLSIGGRAGKYETRDQHMAKYVSLINLRLGSFMALRLEHVLRSSNEKADALATIVASLPIKEAVLLRVYYQPKSSITTNQVNEVNETGPSWMTPVVLYLSSGELSDNRAKAHKIQVQVAQFSLINIQLYKQSLGKTYLKCLTQQ